MSNNALFEDLLVEELSGEEQGSISGGDGGGYNPYQPPSYPGGGYGGNFNPYQYAPITQEQYNNWAAERMLDKMYPDGPPNPYGGGGGD